METEIDGHLPFMDIDVSLGHTVFRKATVTNLYLNTPLHHNPANKSSVLCMSARRARAIYS
jgi:hypothetical protein